MSRWEVRSDYGTFEIAKVVEAVSEEDAYDQTGIMLDLIQAGWTIISYPEGEHHVIKEIMT